MLDKLIHSFDQALRSLVPGTTSAQRENPAQPVETQLTVSDARHVAGLMRVNHSGEVCAQALYHGQAMTAKLPNVRREMEQAAIEEQDHLAWCEDRLKELDTSYQPAQSGLVRSFLRYGCNCRNRRRQIQPGLCMAETERQVSMHLQHHISQLPPQDEAFIVVF